MNRHSLRLLIAVALCSAATLEAADWPQWLGPERDSVWREDGIVTSFPPSGPPVVWRAEIGAGYSGPSVAQGKVFVFDRQMSTNAANPRTRLRAGRFPALNASPAWTPPMESNFGGLNTTVLIR